MNETEILLESLTNELGIFEMVIKDIGYVGDSRRWAMLKTTSVPCSTPGKPPLGFPCRLPPWRSTDAGNGQNQLQVGQGHRGHGRLRDQEGVAHETGAQVTPVHHGVG